MTLSETRRGPGRLSPFVVRSEDLDEAMTVLNAWWKYVLVLHSTQMIATSHQFSHRYESEDYTIHWFCLTPR